jgi:hypothetical protein
MLSAMIPHGNNEESSCGREAGEVMIKVYSGIESIIHSSLTERGPWDGLGLPRRKDEVQDVRGVFRFTHECSLPSGRMDADAARRQHRHAKICSPVQREPIMVKIFFPCPGGGGVWWGMKGQHKIRTIGTTHNNNAQPHYNNT